MAHELNEKVAFDAVIDAVELVCGYPREELQPDQLVENLQIDSLSAAEVVQQVEAATGTEVDMAALASSWGTLTLAELAAKFTRQDQGAPEGA